MKTLLDIKKGVQILLQEAPASYAGAIDGQLGPKSLAAFNRLAAATEDAPLPPAPDSAGLIHNAWPLEANAEAFYGTRPSLTQIEVAYPMRMEDGGKWVPITRITCHVKVAASLRRIFAAILAHFGSIEAIQAVGADVYDGCYADRLVRGSSSKRSMHSYGAAIDIDAEHNPLGATSGKMSPEVVAIFKAEGWRWGGDYEGRLDLMHFEACR